MPHSTAIASPDQTTFYQDLVALMATPAFQRFCQKYMSSWTDIETSLVFIKLYQALAQYTHEPEAIVQVVDRIMNNAVARRQTIQCFRDFQQNDRCIHFDRDLYLPQG